MEVSLVEDVLECWSESTYHRVELTHERARSLFGAAVWLAEDQACLLVLPHLAESVLRFVLDPREVSSVPLDRLVAEHLAPRERIEASCLGPVVLHESGVVAFDPDATVRWRREGLPPHYVTLESDAVVVEPMDGAGWRYDLDSGERFDDAPPQTS